MAEISLAKQETKAKEYLREVRRAQRALILAQAENAEQRKAIDGVRAMQYDKDGGHSALTHGDDAIMQTLERLNKLERKVHKRMNEYAEVLEDWQAIGSTMDGYMFELLNAHYIEGEDWQSIADRLCMSKRTVLRERVFALSDLYNVLPPAWK